MNKGLRAAARQVFAATHQRCRIHWMPDALAHARAKQRSAVAAMLKTILAQESKADAVAQSDVVAAALSETQPKLAALMEDAGDQRRMDRGAALHGAGVPRPRHRYSQAA